MEELGRKAEMMGCEVGLLSEQNAELQQKLARCTCGAAQWQITSADDDLYEVSQSLKTYYSQKLVRLRKPGDLIRPRLE